MASGRSQKVTFPPYQAPAATGFGSAVDAASDARAVVAPSWVQFAKRPLRRLLRLSLDEASFGRRGFIETAPAKRLSLEAAGKTFIGGYNVAIVADRLDDVLRHIDTISPDLRGFAVEGAAMGCAITGFLSFRLALLSAYVRALDQDFSYLTHVGAGWAMARLPGRHNRILSLLDPVHHWLADDGMGFHDAYFHHRLGLNRRHRRRAGYAARAYDQGVGRALWFISGGSVAGAVGLISSIAGSRRSDLWSGLGLAMAYAGPADSHEISAALQAAGECGPHFAQGLAFACEARARARHIPAHTELAAKAASGLDADKISNLVRTARLDLPAREADAPPYEVWRRKVAAAMSPMLER